MQNTQLPGKAGVLMLYCYVPFSEIRGSPLMTVVIVTFLAQGDTVKC
jgi:hypothetical protein